MWRKGSQVLAGVGGGAGQRGCHTSGAVGEARGTILWDKGGQRGKERTCTNAARKGDAGKDRNEGVRGRRPQQKMTMRKGGGGRGEGGRVGGGGR